MILWKLLITVIIFSRALTQICQTIHNDVIKWKHFPRYWPLVRGIHRSPVNSSHKGQWRGALMFSFICAWINGWVNNRDLRRHRAHYDIIVIWKAMVTGMSQHTWSKLFLSSLNFECVEMQTVLKTIRTLASKQLLCWWHFHGLHRKNCTYHNLTTACNDESTTLYWCFPWITQNRQSCTTLQKGGRISFDNFRPVSLLSSILKVVEK